MKFLQKRDASSLIGLLGAGSFARELVCWAKGTESLRVGVMFNGLRDPHDCEHTGLRVTNSLEENRSYVIAVSEPSVKVALLAQLPHLPPLTVLVSPKAILGDESRITIGPGSVICPGAVLPTHITLGKFVSLNYNTTIGHDCSIGDLSNVAPGANVSGNCVLGSRVSVGANAVIREKTRICDDVVIGMGAVVVKDITEPGVYVGNPARLVVKQGL